MNFFQIYTGSGKGKTTAAFGLALRAAGRGQRVFIGQFFKHEYSGEALSLKLLPTVTHELFGSPRSVYDPVIDRDKAAARTGMERARTAVASSSFNLVILDELNVAVARGLVPVEDVLELAALRSMTCELVITGRDAHPRLIEAADLVTEMKPLKHYIDKGIAAREGIEY